MATTESDPTGSQLTEDSPTEGGPDTASGFSRLQRSILLAVPLAPFAIGLMTGIVIDCNCHWSPVTFVALLLVASLAFISERVRTHCSLLLIFVAGLAVGGVMHWSRERVIASNAIEQMLRPEGTILRARGTIASRPNLSGKPDGVFGAWHIDEDRTSFLMHIRTVEGPTGSTLATGTLLVTVREAVLDLAEGDSIEAIGRLLPFASAPNPGSFDWRAYYLQQGVSARLICDQRESVARLSRQGAGMASWLRKKARGLLVDDIAGTNQEEASLLEAMVLGHRSKFDRRLNEVFTRAGCVHFIAASGTNIIVLMGALWFAGRFVGLDKRQCAVGMMLAILLYVVVAEARPPILRASIMGLMFCASLLLRRPTNNLNWICAAAIALCLIDPKAVFDVGFQLSFAAVLGVAYLSPALFRALIDAYWETRHTILRDPYARADQYLRKGAMRFAESTSVMRLQRVCWTACYATALVCMVSMAAWLANLPLTAAWFQRVQPWGVFSSVVVYPLMSIVMILGLLKVAVAAFSPALASVVTSILSFIDWIMIEAVEWMADLPSASTTVPPPPWWLVAAFYLLLFLFALSFRRSSETGLERVLNTPNGKSKRFTRVFAMALAAIAFGAGCVAWSSSQRTAGKLSVTVLSVGAGLAVVIELSNGETILYDAGSLGAIDVGRNTVAPFLRYHGIHRIREIYVSHPNLDHYNGIPGLVNEIPTGPIHFNQCFAELARSPARKLIEHLQSISHPVQVLEAHTQQWDIGEVRIEKLWPICETCESLTPNDASAVLRMTFAGKSILLTGDIEETAQRALMSSRDLQADVLVLPHHGSVCATTAQFLKEVGADVLIRSSGERMADTQNGLNGLIGPATLYNTADCGAITIEIDNEGSRVETWLPCTPVASR